MRGLGNNLDNGGSFCSKQQFSVVVTSDCCFVLK